MQNKKTVLIVLNYNDYKTTMDFLDKIADYNSIFKIIVVDNKSEDGSYEHLSKLESEKIDVIQTEYNCGYAAGNNYGCKYAIEKYLPEFLIISNPDVEFPESIIAKMQYVYFTHDRVGQVTALMQSVPPRKLSSFWDIPTYSKCLIENLLVASRLQYIIKSAIDKRTKEETLEVEAVPGSFFMISTKAFLEIEGFDTETFLYYEENILACRLKNKGFHNCVLMSEHYTHMQGVSINKIYKSSIKKLKLCQDSRYYFCKQYLKCNKLELFFLQMTYIMGSGEILFLDGLRNLLLRKTQEN